MRSKFTSELRLKHHCFVFWLWQGEDCSSDRISSKKELLEGQMQALKALVLGSCGSQA